MRFFDLNCYSMFYLVYNIRILGLNIQHKTLDSKKHVSPKIYYCTRQNQNRVWLKHSQHGIEHSYVKNTTNKPQSKHSGLDTPRLLPNEDWIIIVTRLSRAETCRLGFSEIALSYLSLNCRGVYFRKL